MASLQAGDSVLSEQREKSGIDVRRTVLLVDNADNRNLALSSRNLDGVKLVSSRDVNVYDLLGHEHILLSQAAAQKLSEALVRNIHQAEKFTHYLEINPDGLNVIKGRSGVYVIPNEVPLDLNNRIISSGKVSDQ